MEIKMPRGRVPVDKAKLALYIKGVAAMNGISVQSAEQFVLNRSKTAATVAQTVSAVGPIAEPVEESKETDQEILNRISERFSTMQTIVRAACNGTQRSVIISGAGGIGKTFQVERILESYKENKNLKFNVVRGGAISPISLYQLLWKYREPNTVLTLDDADSIFWDHDALSILKAALDTGKTRKISWHTQSHTLKNDGIPEEFMYEGTMIFITNIDFQRIIDRGAGKLVPHLQALLTRAMYLDLKLHSNREIMLYMEFLNSKAHIGIQNGLNAEQEKEVVKFMREHMTAFRNLSLRTFIKICSCVVMNPNNWKTIALQVETDK